MTATDEKTGEVLDSDALQHGHPCDQYNRPYGFPLWKDGPVLGGKEWRAFAAKQRDMVRSLSKRAERLSA